MTKRPVCLVCLLLMLILWLGDRLGIPLIRGNPLPKELVSQVEKHPESTICGEVERCQETEVSQSVYLKQTYLINHSKKISIKNVRVFLKKKEELPAGTYVYVSGNLEAVEGPRNPGEFDSRQYYACQHIYYFLKKGVVLRKSTTYSRYGQLLLDLKERLANALDACTGKAAPVFCAIVLGDKSSMEAETKMRYQMAGIVHILAISGLHISLLGVGLYQALINMGLGIWLSGLLSLAVMLQYGMITGGNVSAMRAVCMFLLAVGAKMLGRIYDMMTALALTAILILLDAPANLYGSGFLLSFGSVFGIGVVSPGVIRLAGGGTDGGAAAKIKRAFLSSLSIQLTTLPVMLWCFGEVSVAGIFLNLIVLPSVGVVLGSGAGAALAGCISPALGWAAGLPGRAILRGYDMLCKTAGRVPFCTWIKGQPEMWQMLVYYIVIGCVLAIGGLREKDGKKGRAVCILLICSAVFLLGRHPDSRLSVTCLDVGQGDGIVIRSPEGRHFLIDGGSSNKKELGQYQLLPYLKSQGISYLDGIFISHTDSDHISGVLELLGFMGEGLTTIRAGRIFLPDWSDPPPQWKELKELAKRAGVTVTPVHAGNIWRAGQITFRILAPAEKARGIDVNEEGQVIQLEYGSFRGLFTGDIGEETEKKLLKELEDVDFLKVGHHGSRYSSCIPFLEKLRPKIGVISCSASNRYGHPSDETIERLERAGCHLEYTMKNGAITIAADGRKTGIRRFLAS